MSLFPNPEHAGEMASFEPSSDHIFEWSLRPGWKAALFLIPIIAGSVWLALEVIRVVQVTFQVNTVSVTDIQKAIDRDPNNSDLVHRLGLVYSTNPLDLNLPEAEIHLRRAVILNPRRWDYWSDLGVACDFAGDTKCSDEAYERAVALNPMTPAVQWSVANHYLLTDRQPKAFAHFRILLDMDRKYLGPTFQLCLRAARDPLAIYADVIPHGKDASARFAFLLYLSSAADYENAMRIWGQMVAGPDRSPDLAMVKPYLDFLIDHNQFAYAKVVWNDLQHAGVVAPAATSQSADLLYDGGFEGVRVNTGFDWRISDSQDLIFDFSDTSAHGDAKCLRISFAVGRNAEYELLNQVVPTKPDTRYQLVAYVRSENLTSASGPRLAVREMGCEGCNAWTSDPTLGTTSWHALQVPFMTHAQTQAVRVSFWRPRDQTVSGDITGTVWIDDVSLRAVGGPESPTSQARIP